MSHSKISFQYYAMLLLVIFSISYVITLNLTHNQPSLGSPRHVFHRSNPKNTNAQPDGLERALQEASTRDRTVIIAVINKAYIEGEKPMLDLFLDGFWLGEGTRGLVDHLLIVAMDRASHARCRFLRLHCYKLEAEGVDFAGENVYMSEDFIKMMWARTSFLATVLRRGYNFIFTDIDVLWLRNPFPILEPSQSFDMQISTDKFRGNPRSENHRVNTGFYLIRSNNKTRALFEAWSANRDNSTGLKEQDVLQNLMRQGYFRELNLGVKFLDTVHFSGFCQDSRDVAAVATVHANCCRGITAKLADLTAVVRDWKRYKQSATANGSVVGFRWSPHRACRDSWRH